MFLAIPKFVRVKDIHNTLEQRTSRTNRFSKKYAGEKIYFNICIISVSLKPVASII